MSIWSGWQDCQYADIQVGDEVKSVIHYSDDEQVISIITVTRKAGGRVFGTWRNYPTERALSFNSEITNLDPWSDVTAETRRLYRRSRVKTYKIEGLTENEVQMLRDKIREYRSGGRWHSLVDKIVEEE